MWVLGMDTSLVNFDYPLIVSYILNTEEDQRTFAEIGLPPSATGWQSTPYILVIGTSNEGCSISTGITHVCLSTSLD